MADLSRQLLAEDADILPPSDDRIFKVLLTHPDAKQILMDIISTVIEQKVTDVQIRNVELPISDIDEKEERFDVNCTIENGDQVEVEMHSTPICESGKIRKSFINKCVYFLTDLHSSQKSRGVKYHKLVRTYQITFASHPVFKGHQSFVSRFLLRDEEGRVFTDQINQIIIELSKLNDIIKKPVEQLTEFEKWLLFLRFAPDTVQRNKINDIIREKEEIGMAAAILQEISQDEKERAHFRSRKKAEMDRIHNMLTSEEIGELRSDKKWQVIVAEKDARLVEKDMLITNKDTELADKDAEIARLQAELEKYKK